MTYVLGARSLSRLDGVHPHLVTVVRRAIEVSEVDFSVICGVRTVAEQEKLYAQGRTTEELRAKGLLGLTGEPHKRKVTWTMNSNHFKRDSGYGHAVDLAPYVNGSIKWDDWRLFIQIADSMKSVAASLSYPVTWGGDWTKPDMPHFELPRTYHPT